MNDGSTGGFVVIGLVILFAFMPAISALSGRGAGLIFFTFICCGLSLLVFAFPLAGIAAWVIGWVFSMMARSARARDDRDDVIEARMAELERQSRTGH